MGRSIGKDLQPVGGRRQASEIVILGPVVDFGRTGGTEWAGPVYLHNICLKWFKFCCYSQMNSNNYKTFLQNVQIYPCIVLKVTPFYGK